MNTEIYPWDTREQQSLVKPYGFVDFHREFFDEYIQKRESNISFFREKYLEVANLRDPTIKEAVQIQLRFPEFQDKKLEDKINFITDILDIALLQILNPIYSLDGLKSLKEINVPKMIKTLYENIYHEGNINNPMFLNHMRRILKKVELRKLRTEYNSNFINTTKEYLRLEDYEYLVVTLGMHSRTGDLQSLSTTLKLNDFLISRKGELNSPLEFILNYTSLKLEKEQVEKIAKSKGGIK